MDVATLGAIPPLKRGGMPKNARMRFESKAKLEPRANMEVVKKLSWTAAGSQPVKMGIAMGSQ